ncbi:hypothetical protein [Candidatus Nitrosocosmicus sp. T]
MKIEVSQVNWKNRTGLFTVYGRATCRYCRKTMNGKNRFNKSRPDNNPSNWWTEWKIIPLALMEHAECPNCSSKNIITENIENIITNEGIDILVSFKCKNCNSTESQIIREFQSLWDITESIKISPDNIEIIEGNSDEINQSFID